MANTPSPSIPSSDSDIIPTTVVLEEPRFPNGDLPPNPHGASLKPSATEPAAHSPADTPHDSVVEATDTPPQDLFRKHIDPDTQAPAQMLHKSETETAARPRTKPRVSLLGRHRSATNAQEQKLERQSTLTFDPYSSSDDSSSGSEDELHNHGMAAQLEQQESEEHESHKRRRRKHTGPFSMFRLANDDFKSKGRVSRKDGRLKLSIHETVNSGYFAKTLGAGLKKHLRFGEEGAEPDVHQETLKPQDGAADRTAAEDDIMEDLNKRVKLNIVIIVIGSRGDIQPFLKIGKILKEEYGHRVRIATHPAFKEFIEGDSGLEFFSVGGNPSELMAFMVKNPGLLPSFETVKEGEIGRRRAQMYEMFQGMWRACTNATDDENDKTNKAMMGSNPPFVADAIIANPPSFASPHIAERLGIPLHMMFTFPYTPTTQFPHPLANIKATNVDANYTNFMSYPLVEMMTWQGLGDLINRFRTKTLMLEDVSTLWAPGQLYRLKVPYTYLWSPGLVPKPKDWGPEIDIAGFVFLDLASSFKPPSELEAFLNAGDAPVYIGFGSIVVDDPDKFTEMIFTAVKAAGVRALVSKGWGGIGGTGNDVSDNIFMLENTPHDWLFPRVSAVIHHGGAGTTAIGLKCGCPTMIVPFFGDQPFWGGMVSKARAGAHECIPYKKLTAERLAEGIKQCLTLEAKQNAQKLADSIAKEGDGALNAVRSFHRALPLNGENNMRCQLLPNRVAVWKMKTTNLRLCPLVAEVLVEWKKIRWNELRLLRHCEWNDFGGPGEPITGIWGAVVGTLGDVGTGVGLVPVKMARSVKTREEYYTKRFRIKKRDKKRRETLAKVNATTTTPATTRPSAPKREETTLSKLSEPEDYLAQELAQEATHGLRKTTTSLLKLPLTVSLAITQGLHNAPRLYGDETVRRPPRITGLHSGLRAGRDELFFGIHDGVTGLWRLPAKGWKEGKGGGRSLAGGLRGVGMGVGGFVLKDMAACMGPGAYALKGLEVQSLRKYQPTSFLRKSRIQQGRREFEDLGARDAVSDEEEDVDRRREVEMQVEKNWEDVQERIQRETRGRGKGVRAGLVASVFGSGHHKSGRPIPRKSSSTHRSNSKSPPRRSSSTAREQPLNNGRVKPALSLPLQQAGVIEGVKHTDSAPGTSMVWKEKGWGTKKKKRVEDVPAPLREQIRADAVN